MAVTNDQIISWLQSNPGATDATIASTMQQFGVTPAQMAQATGLDTGVVQARYNAGLPAFAAQTQPAYFQQNPDVAAAFQQNSYGLTPEQFAQTHYERFGVNERRAAPTTAVTGLPAALNQVTGGTNTTTGTATTPTAAPTAAPTPAPTAPAATDAVDPYLYAFELGNTNNNFSALASLLKSTPDTQALISKYNLSKDQIDKIEFGTGIDLDKSGGFGAGQVGSNWDYNKFYDSMNDGSTDTKYLAGLLDPLRTLDPLLARNANNLFNEMIQQQSVTGGAWGSGKLGSKESAALDYALRLAEAGVTSLKDIKQETYTDYDGEGGSRDATRLVNSKTGEVIGYDGAFTHSVGGGNRLGYALNVTENGTVVPYTVTQRSDWVNFREGTLKPVASMIAMANPALMPYFAAGNAVNAANKGDWGSAIVSGLTAALGFGGNLGLTDATMATLNQAKTGAQVLNAIEKGNPLQIANALMQTDTGKDLLKMDMGGGITLGNVLNTARVAAAVNAGDYAGAASYAGSLLNNQDLRVAGSSLALINAINSGDPFKIVSAMGQLDKSVKTATKDSDGGIQNRVVDGTIPQGNGITNVLSDAGLVTGDGQFAGGATLTDEDIANITGDGTGTYTGTQVADVGGGVASGTFVPSWMSLASDERVVGASPTENGVSSYVVERTNPNNPDQTLTYRVWRNPDTGVLRYEVLGSIADNVAGDGVELGSTITRTKPKVDWESEEKPSGSIGGGSGIAGTPAGEVTIGGKTSSDYAQDVLNIINQTGGGSGGDSNQNVDLTKLLGVTGGTAGTTGGTTAGPSGGGNTIGTTGGTAGITGGTPGGTTDVTAGPGGGPGGTTDTGPGAGPGTGPSAGPGAGGPGTGGPGAGGPGGPGTGPGTGPGEGPGTGPGTGPDTDGPSGPTPTAAPTPAPTAAPTPAPTAAPTPAPTPAPRPTTPPPPKKEIARILGVPVSSPLVQDVIEALYGTMEYLDIGEEFDPSNRKVTPAATQKQLQQTKMAQGGYLDTMLAEEMSVDDLLKLLR